MIFRKVVHTRCKGSEDSQCENFLQKKQLQAFKKHCTVCGSKTEGVLGINGVAVVIAGLAAVAATGSIYWQVNRSTGLRGGLTTTLRIMESTDASPRVSRSGASGDPGSANEKSLKVLEDFVRRGDYASAVKVGEVALRSMPTDATLLNNVANALLKQGDIHRARGYLQQAVALKPNDPYLRYNLGCVETRGGNKEAAVRHLKEACQLGLAPATFRQDPDLVSLLGYGPFEDLTVSRKCQ